MVAGNTEVSQATCNALFGALGAIACSQATMNNFLFGDATRQYYETICGGTGAGPGFDGTSAIQTHMTNTRMTDPEVLELRYPVRLEAFAIRRGSGGAGKWRGGDGAIRRIRFLEPMTAVIVVLAPQRRAVRAGGRRGWRCRAGNGWSAPTAAHEILTGTDSAELAAGRRVRDRDAGRRRLRRRRLTCHARAHALVIGCRRWLPARGAGGLAGAAMARLEPLSRHDRGAGQRHARPAGHASTGRSR